MEIDSTRWPEFSALIDRMLDQPEAAREAWVRALQGADAAYTPKLLEMLKPTGRTRASVWFDTLPKLSDLDSGPGPDASQLLEQAGDEIGPYRLQRLLGTGGMASVWYAERGDQLKRRAVALKLPLALPSRALAARFEREREILAGLVHPNIARLYDAGISAGGRAYLALEYVEGESLDKYCNGRHIGLAARIDLFQQVLAAVQYAHSRLVVHRDLKPGNILVTGEGQVRLLDFGVAKLLDTENIDDTELTRVSGAGMTLAYAAPEQIAGQTVSTATDVYALGVVLYELLTGNRPYRLGGDSRHALEEAILKGDIDLPSAAPLSPEAAAQRGETPARLKRELRGDLDAILLKALQREPGQRYATVAAFAEDLTRYRRGEAVMAHRASRGYQLRKFVVRNRLVVGSAGAAGIALLIGAGVAIWQAREAQRQERIAEQERDRALSAAEHREAVDEFLSDLLIDAGRSGEPVSVPTLVARAESISAKEFSGNPEVRAAVLRTLGELETDFQDGERALKYFTEAQQLLQGSPDLSLRASVTCNRAMLLGIGGQVTESEAAFREFLDDPKTVPSIRSECLGQRGWLALYLGDGAAAAPLVDAALAQLAQSGRSSEMKTLKLQTERAMILVALGQPAKADREYVRILDRLRLLGRERGELADAIRLERIAAAFDGGDFNLALAVIEESINTSRIDFPELVPLQQLYERAAVLALLERNMEALEGFDQVAALGASRNATLQRRANLDAAEVLSRMGRPEEAEKRFRLANRMGDEAGSSARAQDLAALVARGKMELNLGRYKLALAAFSRASALAAIPAGTLARLHHYRSIAEFGAGDIDDALRDARSAVEASERQRGDRANSFWAGSAYLQLAQVLQAKGELGPAQEAYKSAIVQIGGSAGPEHPAVARARSALRALENSTGRS